jgi:Protein of unknown function (DUF669)
MPSTKYDPNSNPFELIPVGEYDVEVVEAKERTSAAGNPTISLQLKLENNRRVFDNLTFTEKSAYRIANFMEAAGMDVGDNLDLSAQDCLGKSVRVKLGVRKNSKNQRDENTVLEYFSVGF